VSKNRGIYLTGGGVAVLLGIILIFLMRFTGLGPGRTLFKPKEFRAVTSTAESIESTALLECAVYRIRAVYPYDFPQLEDNPSILIDRGDFAVITSRIAAGFDLAGKNFIQKEGNRIILNPGPVQITSFVIEDDLLMGEGFPDMAVTPEEWRFIVEEVTPFLEQMALERGILEEAEQFGRDFLVKLYEGAGYGDVQFTK
jgi:hypothetical protein